MGVTSSNKQIDVNRIDCDGSLKVTLALSAAPDISSSPTDIVLVLDRSGSMAGSPLANMKAGAKTFSTLLTKPRIVLRTETSGPAAESELSVFPIRHSQYAADYVRCHT